MVEQSSSSSRYIMKQGSMSERSMVSKEIVSNILSDSATQRTHVNNILFPGATFSAREHLNTNTQQQQSYEDVIILEHHLR